MKCFNKIFFIFFVSFCSICLVKAETGYVDDSSGLNLRDKPNVEDSIVISSIPNKKEFYISNMEAGTGNGCNDSWYYVYYNNTYGYVCSTYVKIKEDVVEISYDRPWTSPKKAIVGGAKFISKTYIAKGQYTSYLKKFNVNPSGYYSPYTHQYMANLAAPMSEASTTYSSLVKNELLDNVINFVIPVFLEMPETTYDSNIKNIERGTADVQDEVFEQSISAFDESYKPYLRYLHTIHPKWTFTPLITNLDFNTSVAAEKVASSINISSGLCEQDPYYVTESGWCIAEDAVVSFYLDPRNFLNEKYIFMFENLGYSEIYNEDVVQSVLNNSFMSDLSILDNQKYSSIFVEAGVTANISPLYLASLAIQESSRKETNTTSGKEFTYQGYSYKGLYNFFNIGANSSEENPALAGLVWANGGKGVSIIVGEDNVIEIVDYIALLKLTSVGDYFKGYSLGTTVKSVKEKVTNDAKVVIKDASGTELSDDKSIGTGNVIEISDKNGNLSYTYVMYGDLNGDGEINSADLLVLRQHLLGISSLKNANLVSAYLNDDSEINSADLLILRQHLLGTTKINK